MVLRGEGRVKDYLRPVVWCSATTTIRQASRDITEAGQSCALIREGSDLAIVTDSDVRRKVGTGEFPIDAPVVRIATAPVHCIPSGSTLAAALLSMVEHGVRHLVVVDEEQRPTGVVRAVEVAAGEIRDPLVVRAAVRSASDLGELVEACRLLPSSTIELVDRGFPALQVAAVLSSLVQAVVSHLLQLGPEAADPGATDCCWLFLGSYARKEPLPLSDLDTALLWAEEAAVAERLLSAADGVLGTLGKCGLQRCPDGATADNPLISRSLPAWQRATGRWAIEPTVDDALLCAMISDNLPVNRADLASQLAEMVTDAARGRDLLRLLLRLSLAAKPATGLFRGLVVERDGEHRGRLDLKRHGLSPVTAIGRWVAIAAGNTEGSTTDRLARGAEAGLLTMDEAQTLSGAFQQIHALLQAREVAAMKATRPVSRFIAPRELDSLTRRELRECFRVTGHVQGRLEKEWSVRLS
jgi:CBS domain-containing protein